MTLKAAFRTIAAGVMLLVSVGVAAAAEDGTHLPHNHLAFVVDYAEEEQKDGHHESGGVDVLSGFLNRIKAGRAQLIAEPHMDPYVGEGIEDE